MNTACERDSDAAIRQWHWAVLRRSLRLVLDGRTSPDTRGEIVRWLMSEWEGPFSFATCCRLEGVNPQALRERLFQRLSRQGLADADRRCQARGPAPVARGGPYG